jgi:hypothetical protein
VVNWHVEAFTKREFSERGRKVVYRHVEAFTKREILE